MKVVKTLTSMCFNENVCCFSHITCSI